MIALTAISKMAASRDDEASRTSISGDANLIPVMATARARTYPDLGYEGELKVAAESRRPRGSRRKPWNMHMSSPSIQREPGSVKTNASQSIALGLERIGLISLRFPLLVGLAAIVLLIAAAFGITRIKVDDSLSQLFRSETPEFKTFEEVTRRFPSNEFDVLIVVEGKNLLERGSIEKLRDLVTDLQLIDGTRGIISMFSARQPPQGDALPAPLFPDQLPAGAEYDQLVQRVKNNEIIRGKLLSEDGQLTLIVLALDPDVVASSRLRDVAGEIEEANDTDHAGTGR